MGCLRLPQLRIADVLDIGNSGVEASLFAFALRGHFDFVVAEKLSPIFAVEFDGPMHTTPEQRQRDEKKQRLSFCQSSGARGTSRCGCPRSRAPRSRSTAPRDDAGIRSLRTGSGLTLMGTTAASCGSPSTKRRSCTWSPPHVPSFSLSSYLNFSAKCSVSSSSANLSRLSAVTRCPLFRPRSFQTNGWGNE